MPPPVTSVAMAGTSSATPADVMERDEYAELFALFWSHRRDDNDETRRFARAMAAACAHDDHLWEDLRLPDRATLSRLIRAHFPTLYHKNTANMRWKKFFYKQLCDRATARVCRAPSCGACRDYQECFGPE